MSRNNIKWEQEAAITALRRLLRDTGVNAAELTRQLRSELNADKENAARAMRLTKSDAEELFQRLEDGKDRTLYTLLTNIKNGHKARGLNLSLVTWFVHHDEHLAIMAEEVLEDIRLRHTYPDVFMLQRQFDDRGSGQLDCALAMQGEYVLYRPYYYDFKNRVMRLRLIIGTVKNPFYVALEHRYDASEFHHGIKEYTFEGIVAPLPDRERAMISLHSADKSIIDGTQLLYVDHMSGFGRKTKTMTGVALGAIGPSPASAWPFYIRRLKEKEIFEPNVIPRSDPEINSFVEKKLTLGAVKWG